MIRTLIDMKYLVMFLISKRVFYCEKTVFFYFPLVINDTPQVYPSFDIIFIENIWRTYTTLQKAITPRLHFQFIITLLLFAESYDMQLSYMHTNMWYSNMTFQLNINRTRTV